jgi:hypothetical protein
MDVPNDRLESTEAAAALVRAFAPDAPAGPEIQSLEQVRAFLVTKIRRLLDRNVAMLMSILYRVDVAEADVMRVLAEAAPDDVAVELADLMIERQLLKVRIRRQYRDV